MQKIYHRLQLQPPNPMDFEGEIIGCHNNLKILWILKEYYRLQLQPQDPMDVQELTSVPYAKDRIIMMDSQELMSVPYAQDTS